MLGQEVDDSFAIVYNMTLVLEALDLRYSIS
jgi:hypothetical protein